MRKTAQTFASRKMPKGPLTVESLPPDARAAFLKQIAAAIRRKDNAQFRDWARMPKPYKPSAEKVLAVFVKELQDRLRVNPVCFHSVRLIIESDSDAETVFRGRTTRQIVPGLCALVGRFVFINTHGERQTVALSPKWVSHPFWQVARHVV